MRFWRSQGIFLEPLRKASHSVGNAYMEECPAPSLRNVSPCSWLWHVAAIEFKMILARVISATILIASALAQNESIGRPTNRLPECMVS